VTLVDHDHIGWKSWKLIAWTISATSSLFIAKRSSTYSQGNMEKFWGKNVHSTPTSIMSGWIESTESYVILGGGVAFCLLLSAHRTVIFAIALFSCYSYCWSCVWQFFIKWRWFMFVWLIDYWPWLQLWPPSLCNTLVDCEQSFRLRDVKNSASTAIAVAWVQQLRLWVCVSACRCLMHLYLSVF